MAYYIYDLGLNLLQTFIQAMERCRPPTDICRPPSVPWECDPTVMCRMPSIWECQPTVLRPRGTGRLGDACRADSCLGSSRIMARVETIADLDELQAELRAAMDQVDEHRQKVVDAMSDEDIQSELARHAEQVERLRRILDDREG